MQDMGETLQLSSSALTCCKHACREPGCAIQGMLCRQQKALQWEDPRPNQREQGHVVQRYTATRRFLPVVEPLREGLGMGPGTMIVITLLLPKG